MGNGFSQMRFSNLQYLVLIVIATQPQLVQAWNDHYDKEDGKFNRSLFDFFKNFLTSPLRVSLRYSDIKST